MSGQTYNKIPEELRRLPQWVAASADKKPIDPKTGKAASSTDPNTWATFEQACACGAPHIGFVVTENDPYTFIDLDTGKNPNDWLPLHAQIVMEADSWTETSRSGTGSHIIVKSNFKGGRRADNKGIEIYGSGRYMLATGWVYHDVPIREDQELVEFIIQQMDSTRFVIGELTSEESEYSDTQLLDKMANSTNGQKFMDLYNGDWQDYDEYQNDHSRADLGLATFIDFYTRDVEQAVRIFKMSKLYRSEKGRAGGDGTDYIIRTLKQARARNEATPPPIEESAIMQRANEVMENRETKEAQKINNIPPPEDLLMPPGLVGDIANYIFSAAIRPVREVALMGALTFVAGVIGRQYNISGTGLNLYSILLAPTGIGKEGAASGIGLLVSKVRETVPSIDEFRGPSDFMSGQALIKTLDKRNCIYCIIGEFGLRMQQMAASNANNSEKGLEKNFLDLFNKSGWHNTFEPIAYSDSDKSTTRIQAPALSIMGESTPENFYKGLNETAIASGLLPRFMFLHYKGDRPNKNEVSAFCQPPPELVSRVADMAATVIQMQANAQCVNVLANAEAQKIFRAFDKLADSKIRGGTEIYRHLWNRADVKAQKLAAVIAVGINNVHPVITADMATWAINFVKQDVATIENQFKEENLGAGDLAKGESVIIKACEDFLTMPPEKRNIYKAGKKFLSGNYIPFGYLREKTKQTQPFKDKPYLFEQAIQMLIKSDVLDQLPNDQVRKLFGLTKPVYVFGQNC
jgi:hypothetical protein